jgi:hypothetical protein
LACFVVNTKYHRQSRDLTRLLERLVVTHSWRPLSLELHVPTPKKEIGCIQASRLPFATSGS